MLRGTEAVGAPLYQARGTTSELAVSVHPMPAKLRIAFLVKHAGPGGAEVLLAEFLRRLDRQTCEAVVVCGASGWLTARLSALDLPVHVLPLAAVLQAGGPGTRLPRPGMIWQLAALLRQQRIDLIHSWTLETRNVAHLCALLLDRPLLQGCHDLYHGASIGALQWWLLNHIPRRLIATSQAVARSLRVGERLAAHRVTVIHPGIAPEHSVPLSGAERAALRASLGVAGAAPLVGLIGRSDRVKGHAVFLRAMARVRQSHPQLRVLLVGAPVFDGDAAERDIAQTIQSLGLGPVVLRTGFRADAAQLAGTLDVLACASFEESFGLTLVEAGARAVPVVATRCGGPEEIVVDGVTGLLVPVGDAPGMAAAVGTLLDTPQRARALGRAGQWHVRRHFNLDTMVTQHLDLYLETQHRRAHRAPAGSAREARA